MIKSYKLKIYANKTKLKEINKLISFWQDQVNKKISIFWMFKEIRGLYCPYKYSLGGRLIKDASIKAWQIVKGARYSNQKEKPYYRGNEIDLNQSSAYIIPEFKTKNFDIWFRVISLNKYKRFKIPCKRTKIFNEALERGKLKRSFRLEKINDEYYMTCFIELLEIKKDNKKLIGIDVGLNNTAVTSDNKVFGNDLKDLRIRTKWRKYKNRLTPFKQGLNRVAKEIVNNYSNTDFVVEDLLFKGKNKRTRGFRRRNNNWAYKHLANRLEKIGKVEGFNLIKVNPAWSSLECPLCGFTNATNRQGSLFLCNQCGFKGNVDYVGALNLVGRVVKEQFVS